ncbi:MAG: NADP-dependent oxidoreductase [Syntrophorhabdales bacterium]|jgi:NADPH:quinone reductase-like Zn-dependent oxidoreductase
MAAMTMKAVRMHRYGGPEVLVYEDAPRPEPGEGEILIRVHAAGVNPLDWKVRAGRLKDRLQHKLPLIPGWDVSGVVESLGPAVESPQVGEQVFARLDTRRDGAYAEYTVSDARIVAKKPLSIDHVLAASVPLASLTAWQALFEAGQLVPGQRVLIHGAAGSVGAFAVQFAKQKGAWSRPP